MRSRLSFALLALLAVAGCKSSVEEVEQTSLSVIADQAHGSRTGFWFLPPMVPSPQLEGTFLGGLSPVVRIDELDASLHPLRTVATFTRSSGPGSETVRETTEPLYIVNWKTRQFDLDPNRLYRVNVLLSDRVVGFADVKIVADKNEAKRIDTNDFVPLWSDGTLPIKFWINRCGPIVCAALDQCHVAGVCDGATGVCTNPVAADGATCSDGNACTRVDSCQAGSCQGTDPVVCTAADQCHIAGVCDPASGSCTSPAAEEGASCDDGDACTATDTCSAGACVGQGTVPACLPCFSHVGQGPADPGGNGGFTTIREGNRLYETAYNGGIRIYDISTGTAPTLVGTIALPGVRALAVRGDLAYVSYFGAGPTVFDVSNPASATKLWQAAPRVGDDASLALELSGNILVETSGMRLRTYDLTDPRAPVEVGVVGFMAGVEIVMDGTTAYVAGTHQGVRKVDITNPAAPVIVSTVDPPGSSYLRHVALTADAVLATDDTAGLHVLARGTLAPLGFVPLEGGAFGITVRGNQAFVATSDAIVIFDVSTPAAPVLVRRVQVHPRLSTRSSVLGDGLAWVAGGVLPNDASTVPTLHVVDIGCL